MTTIRGGSRNWDDSQEELRGDQNDYEIQVTKSVTVGVHERDPDSIGEWDGTRTRPNVL